MLETNNLVKRSAQLQLLAFTLAENLRSGSFKSLSCGHGIEFSDVREYLPGDSVRSIDWNVTARFGRPFIKQYEEDRELSVFFVVDRSLSMFTGSYVPGSLVPQTSKNTASANEARLKIQTASEVAALLLLASERNAGANGAVLFDGAIQKSVPPKAGRDYAMMILSLLDDISSCKVKGSALANALKGAYQLLKKRSLVFVISDFRVSGWEQSFAALCQKHDVVAVRITDAIDSELPSLGMVSFFDTETKKRMLLPTSSKKFKMAWFMNNRSRSEVWHDFCIKHGASPLVISTAEDVSLALSRFLGSKQKK